MRETARILRRAGGWPQGRIPYYWLIVQRTHGQMKVFTRTLDGGEMVLPVFSGEDAASTFAARCGADGWVARKTGAGELISVLFGPCRGCRLVALDPPEEVEIGAALELAGVSREVFMEPILGRGRSWFEDRGRRVAPL